MGVIKLFSGGRYDNDANVGMFSKWNDNERPNLSNGTFQSLPNPRPDNYSVIKHKMINGYLVIEILYHDCINYEGRKIMVYECSYSELMKQKFIDPHFCDNKKYISPIARFEPTSRGWNHAEKFVLSLNER